MSSAKEESYYEILGVSKKATESEIKKSWHKLSMKYHPDRLKGEEKVLYADKMKIINEAYEVLSDPLKREVYDKHGKAGLQNMGDGGNHPFGDIFGSPQRRDYVPPIEIPIYLKLEELYLGKTVKFNLDRKNMCKDCNMTGSKDKVSHPCKDCKGKGFIVKNIQQGPFTQQAKIQCDKCRGNGIQPGTILCLSCKGKLQISEILTKSYDITPGYSHNDVIELEGEGHEIPPQLQQHTSEKRGRVLLVIQEKQHSLFSRANTGKSDLAIIFDITLAESLCGFTRTITHLDGRKLFITHDGGLRHGDVKVIKHEGMPHKSNPLLRGNLLLKFSVEMPQSYDKGAVYKSLTGLSLESLNFTPPSDHIITHLSSLQEIEPDHDETHDQDRGCPVQ